MSDPGPEHKPPCSICGVSTVFRERYWFQGKVYCWNCNPTCGKEELITGRNPDAPEQPTGTKHDTGKLRFDLIPPEAENAMAEILTVGAAKYGDRNWEKGISNDRLLAAVRRHLNAWQLGEKLDPETGRSHLAHALTTLAMMVTFDWRGEQQP